MLRISAVFWRQWPSIFPERHPQPLWAAEPREHAYPLLSDQPRCRRRPCLWQRRDPPWLSVLEMRKFILAPPCATCLCLCTFMATQTPMRVFNPLMAPTPHNCTSSGTLSSRRRVPWTETGDMVLIVYLCRSPTRALTIHPVR